MEREDCGVLGVFFTDSLNSVCRYSWYRLQPGGIPHVHDPILEFTQEGQTVQNKR